LATGIKTSRTLLGQAPFQSRLLSDRFGEREVYFAECAARFADCDLVFFDPDRQEDQSINPPRRSD
jgi:hypothetical protein